jgi:hypothetical protein
MHKWMLALLVTCPLVFAGQNDILVIESYHADYSWDKSYLEGIREGLGEKYQIHTFEMDTKRLPKETFEQRAELAMEAYHNVDPALVILGDDNAFSYLAPRLKNGKTPVVFLGVNANVNDLLNTGYTNVTGVLERPLFKKAILNVRKIVKPRPRKVLILFDSGKTSATAVEEEFQGKSSIQVSAVTADVKTIGNINEWKNTIKFAKADGYEAVLLGLYHTLTDDDGKHIDSNEVLTWTAENSPLPLFAFWDFSVGKGKALGGLVLFGKEQGLMAARLTDLVLSGVRPTSIKPIVSENGRYMYSQAEIDRWKFTIPNIIRYRADIVE